MVCVTELKKISLSVRGDLNNSRFKTLFSTVVPAIVAAAASSVVELVAGKVVSELVGAATMLGEMGAVRKSIYCLISCSLFKKDASSNCSSESFRIMTRYFALSRPLQFRN
eukprot:Lithocolla_globosa_v1_NODE_9814_length_665_cov_10.681967.p2 type:complete len:111 gc:universal NODE_9814_length_665_cov_10.681967:173-505(+)